MIRRAAFMVAVERDDTRARDVLEAVALDGLDVLEAVALDGLDVLARSVLAATRARRTALWLRALAASRPRLGAAS